MGRKIKIKETRDWLGRKHRTTYEGGRKTGETIYSKSGDRVYKEGNLVRKIKHTKNIFGERVDKVYDGYGRIKAKKKIWTDYF